MTAIQDIPPIALFERLEIETQSHCNRSCWFCPRIHDRSGVYLTDTGAPVFQKMATSKVLEMLDQAAEMKFTGHVSFYFYSESLLDKRNLFFAKEARARGMKPYLHTNGDVIKQNDELRNAVREVYEYIVIGIYDYETEEELESQKAFWHQRLDGCDVRFSTIGTGPPGSAPSMATPRALVPTDSRIRVPDLAYRNAPCHRPLIRLIVRYDGRMAMCCEDVNADFDLGNVHESTLAELWYSPRHIEVVRDLMAGRRERHELCRNCPLPPSTAPLDGERILIEPRNYA